MFEIQSTLSFNKDKLVSGNEFDYVTRTSQNQGILLQTGFVNKENINSANNWSLGLLQMDFFYRHKPWYAGQFVRKIIPKIHFSQHSILYLTALLNKQKQNLLSVLVRDVDKTFLNTKICLPVLNDNQINFDFMESYMSEIETECIFNIRNYLLKSGLHNYSLTSKEQEVIDEFENLRWQSFNVEKLFGKATRGKRLKGEDRIQGTLPFVTAGESYEGISAFIGNDVTIFSENTTTIDMFGSAKYRNYKYGGDDHIAVVHTETLSKMVSIFLTSAIHKSSYNGQFNYGRNFYAKDADMLNILLPVREQEPDYDKMETIISAIHKLVIKDLVLYVDRKTMDSQKAL